MKMIISVALFIGVLSVSCSPKTGEVINKPVKGIFFTSASYEKIMAEADSREMPVFLDFYTTWCAPCKWLEEDVFEQSAVGDYFNANFISLKIDAEKGSGPSLAEQYQVYGYPTLVFLDSKGKVIRQHVGMTSTSGFLQMGRETVAANAGIQ